MSITKPAAFGGKEGWEVLSEIARVYATQDIDVARKILSVTRYLKDLENMPETATARLEDIRDELHDLVDRLGNPEKLENLQTALQAKGEELTKVQAQKNELQRAYTETLEIVAEMKENLEQSSTQDLQEQVTALATELKAKKDSITRLMAKHSETEEKYRKLKITHKELKDMKLGTKNNAASAKKDSKAPERKPDNDASKVSS